MQVLTQSQHSNTVSSQVSHNFDDFFVSFTQTNHQTRLSWDFWVSFLESFQQLQRPVVVSTWSNLSVDSWNVFQVVVENVWWSSSQDVQSSVHSTSEVWNQSFDLDLWRLFSDSSDTVSEVLSTTVSQVVSVNRSDNNVSQSHVSDSLSQLNWFVSVWSNWSTVSNVTEWTSSSTDSTQDHESSSTVVETFSQVWTTSFFTNRVQTVLSHSSLDTLDSSRVRWQLDLHPFWLSQESFSFSSNVLNWDQSHLVSVSVLNTSFHNDWLRHCFIFVVKSR
ncbi:hypothetical protein BS732_4450 [Bacillus subtilis MB73/2]|nr:hypothetical protein BS732_4450 [Bacillus subtilis MB73/2]